MKVAIIGTRCVSCNIATLMLPYVPKETTEIISGGAKGVDQAAELIAKSLSLPFHAFLPDYSRYGKQAPLVRNREIIRNADEVLAFWDGASRGTMNCIAECIRCGKAVRVIPIETACHS